MLFITESDLTACTEADANCIAAAGLVDKSFSAVAAAWLATLATKLPLPVVDAAASVDEASCAALSGETFWTAGFMNILAAVVKTDCVCVGALD
ncbi:hypothetical protein [Candidatus Methylobacter oryzae]|uniref:Uncharacterized protein n=1 Tax=Candidatus Methylobacter oryzae TaxID=2497749 RepID=A0ABY3CFC5_9GAMM|nr:hypothetical protein [Candidatus Methylobacter oryzae]TRX01024.1 hypothetical protein EKO24_004445 [Candidatus Methylobacter oryzae]